MLVNTRLVYYFQCVRWQWRSDLDNHWSIWCAFFPNKLDKNPVMCVAFIGNISNCSVINMLGIDTSLSEKPLQIKQQYRNGYSLYIRSIKVGWGWGWGSGVWVGAIYSIYTVRLKFALHDVWKATDSWRRQDMEKGFRITVPLNGIHRSPIMTLMWRYCEVIKYIAST